jgi:type VI secretion system secreted protein Hcp
MFLKIDGIKGESTDKAHKDEIDLLSFEFAASNSGSFNMGPGGGAGKSSVTDITVSKYVDAASTELLKHCLTGKHIDKIVLTVRKAGDTPLEYTIITLEKVLVTRYSPSGQKDGDRLTETVALNFAKIVMDYDTQNDKGAKGDHYSAGYSISENAVA